MDRPGGRQVPEGSGEQGKTEKTGCKIVSGAPTTLAVKGEMRDERGVPEADISPFALDSLASVAGWKNRQRNHNYVLPLTLLVHSRGL